MNKHEQRQHDQMLREKYRDAAKAQAEHALILTRVTENDFDVRVDHRAYVKVMENGAFVEAVVWVPKERLVV